MPAGSPDTAKKRKMYRSAVLARRKREAEDKVRGPSLETLAKLDPANRAAATVGAVINAGVNALTGAHKKAKDAKARYERVSAPSAEDKVSSIPPDAKGRRRLTRR